MKFWFFYVKSVFLLQAKPFPKLVFLPCRLNRRLEALSIPKYGSQDSGLNRMGLAAPGTNKHTVEGSNPIWNETINAPDFDAIRYVRSVSI